MPIALIVMLVVTVLGASTYFFVQSRTEETSAPVASDVLEIDEGTSDSTNQDPNPALTDVREEDATPSTNEARMTATVFADGTYTAQGRYLTPARTAHTIDVTLTIEDDIITSSKVVYDGKDGYSNPNQERFDNTYTDQVAGVSLQNVRLSRVGSASLTSQSFNEAIALIIEKAKS